MLSKIYDFMEAEMAHMFERLSVSDYHTFCGIFDSHEDMRQAAGVTGKTVYRSVDDPNEITVRLGFPATEGAKAGVQGPPKM